MSITKGIPTPSVKCQRQWQHQGECQIGSIGRHCDTWKSVPHPFSSVTMLSNGPNLTLTLMLPLPLLLDARCGYTLKLVDFNELTTLVLAAYSVHNKQKLFSHINFSFSVVNYFPCYEHKARVSARDLLKYSTMNTFFLLLENPLFLTQILSS